MKKEPLLDLKALTDPGSATVEIDHEGTPLSIMIIRYRGKVYGYLNRCPHLGTPLDWVPGEVLDHDKRYIICATHGASFRISDGYCVSGPCDGERLVMIPLKVRDGLVFLELA